MKCMILYYTMMLWSEIENVCVSCFRDCVGDEGTILPRVAPTLGDIVTNCL